MCATGTAAQASPCCPTPRPRASVADRRAMQSTAERDPTRASLFVRRPRGRSTISIAVRCERAATASQFLALPPSDWGGTSSGRAKRSGRARTATARPCADESSRAAALNLAVRWRSDETASHPRADPVSWPRASMLGRPTPRAQRNTPPRPTAEARAHLPVKATHFRASLSKYPKGSPPSTHQQKGTH
jgi:hypothetical protein